MSPKNQKHRHDQPNSDQARWNRWLLESLAYLPRPIRMMVSVFFAAMLTFATFPLMAAAFSLTTTVTGDGGLYIEYLFTLNRTALNALLAVSAGGGLIFYVLLWRFYVGTAGTNPEPRPRLLWLYLVGISASVLTTIWLARGVISLSTPV